MFYPVHPNIFTYNELQHGFIYIFKVLGSNWYIESKVIIKSIAESHIVVTPLANYEVVF